MSERARPLALAAFLARPQAEEQIGAFDGSCVSDPASLFNNNDHAFYACLV